ncbi:monocarboxylate transporter 14 [Spodoptera frugiperda]|uniref:Monocarboxylate transporter 14 n=1 Tax=Spodoptera frugiperda TaxID=7108 RepID=A0A9R0CXQ9_SPOFR|nr:monocarboxylate transporter 14 [Spodoptera frugiperda]
MEQDWEPVILRSTRTPKNKELVRESAVRESLLSDSTSGICKGEEDDTTSVGTASFSSPDLEFSTRERLPTIQKKLPNLGDEAIALLDKPKANTVKITVNPADRSIETKKQDEGKSDKDKVKIPDGGWGWVVVMSSFIISMIADGISFSFGLLYIEFLEEFEASKSTTAWIGSLFIAVPLLSGPVMSALVDRYGCRSMTILGGLISTLGFVLASISTTLEMMMITFGVIAGLGLGLVYVTAVVSIAYWFEKKRNLAVGLGACGTGVGTFLYAPMTQYFIDEYGWRGTILLLSGTLLNLCVCGCVMRDPEWWIEEQKRQKSSRDEGKLKKDDDKSRYSSSASISIPYVFDFDAPTRGKSMVGLIKRGVSPEKVIKQEADNIKRHQEIMKLKKCKRLNSKSQSVENLPTYLTYSEKLSMGTLDTLVKKTSRAYGIEVKYPAFAINRTKKQPIKEPSNELDDPPVVKYTNDVLQRTNSEKYENKDKTSDKYELKNPKRKVMRKAQSETKDDRELVKQDSKENRKDWLKKQLSVNHHYLRDLKMPLNSISHRNAMLNIKRYRLKASSCPDIFKNSMITIDEKEENWYDDCFSCLADMFNVTLFKRMTFNLLCLGTIILFIWFIVPYFYLAEHMIHKGYTDDEGAGMLSLIGITNTIGMVGLGWIGDFPQVSIGGLYAVCLVLCGASVAAIPPAAATNYWILASAASAFGLFFAASYTFTPSLLVKLVSLDDFTSAYGLVLLAQGIGHLIGPPLSGFIYDVTLSWELSFYLAGGWIVVAGILVSLIQPVKNYQLRRATLDNVSMA